jgi:hypothetical protein
MGLILIAGSAGLFPCSISFDSGELKALKGKEIPVTVFLCLKHRNCALPLDKTVFEGDGVTIRKKGAWENVKDNLHKVILYVVPLQGQGEIRVIRECGRHETITAALSISAR